MKLKKILAGALVTTILLSSVPLAGTDFTNKSYDVSASAETSDEITVGTLTAATINLTLDELEACDYTVEVPITLTNNPGFSALGFGLTDGKLEYQEVANNCGASMLGDANNGDFTWFNFNSTKLVTKETIATVTLKVPTTAQMGDSYPITLTGIDANGNKAAYANDLSSGSGDLGTYAIQNGSINIIDTDNSIDYVSDFWYLYYEKHENYIEITDCDESVTEVEIPSEIDGLPVTSIGDFAFECKGLTSITIPDSVTSIGDYALAFCDNLTNITIPDSVAYIGGAAFDDTPWLTNKQNENPLVIVNGILIDGSTCSGDIIIPDSVTSISNYTFSWCENLTNITIPDSVISIGDSAFYNCYNLTSIAIPDSVTSISDYTFVCCENLTSVTIPNSVTNIGEGAFQGTSLTDIYYSGTETDWNNISISSDNDELTNATIFYNTTTNTYGSLSYIIYDDYIEITDCNESVTEIEIPCELDGLPVTNIDDYTFDWCFDLTSVIIPKSVTSIGEGAFQSTSLTDIYYSGTETDWNNISIDSDNDELTNATIYYNSVGGLSYNIYDNYAEITKCYDSATEIEIPSEINGLPVSSIGDYAFAFCRNLTNITIPNSITIIGGDAFEECSNLTNITISDSVISIGNMAFAWCENLTNITIPDSVTSIGDNAFYECENLKEITIPESVTSIGGYAFDNTPWLETKQSENSLVIVNGILIDGKTCTGDVIIPDSVTSIGGCAFSFCEQIASITIPNSVTSIGNQAFICCSGLTSITIPDSVVSIGGCAFADCINLIDVTIGNSVTSIGDCAFNECFKLTEITIPESVTSIGYNVFEGKAPKKHMVYYGTYGTVAEDYVTDTYSALVYMGYDTDYEIESIGNNMFKATFNTTIAEYGDMNMDGKIDISDAYDALYYYSQHAAGNTDYTFETGEVGENAADVNQDGTIDITDAYFILSYYSCHAAGEDVTWDDLI